MSKIVKNKPADEKSLWGIDLGGTKIEGVILRSAKDPKVLFRERVPTESDKGYEHILSQIELLINRMKEASGVTPTKIGFGTPGAIDPKTSMLRNSNTTVLNGKPLLLDLQNRLGVSVVIANDANCFALAETRMGIVAERFPKAKVVFGVILGTGVGGGLVIEGKVLNGLHGISGEWGHNFLLEAAGPCYCGKVGCVERVISGPALEQYYFKETGNQKPLKDIVALAESKVDPTAQKTMIRLIEYFGLALSVVINIVDPDVVVIGGGVGNIDLLYDRGKDSLRKYIFNNRLDTPVVQPSLGDSAGVFGAALLTQ